MWSGRGHGCVSPCTNRGCVSIRGSAVSGRPVVTTPSPDPTWPLHGLETPLPMDCPEFRLLLLESCVAMMMESFKNQHLPFIISIAPEISV